MPKPEMRVCSICARNRALLKFYPPDARRVDGFSLRCVSCKKGTYRQGNRNQRLQDTYGITHADYEEILRAQGGACAICKGRRKGNLDVDHDHKAPPGRGSVRGLLCRRCNRRLLPAALDQVKNLESAIAYLLSPPARQVL